MWRRLLPLATVLLVVMLVLVACGDDDDDEDGDDETGAGAGAGETIEVSLNEFTIEMPTTIAAGKVSFVVTNNGKVDHNFEVEGEGIEEEFDEDLKPGETQTLELDLKAGTYEVYCPVGNHEDQGMEVELTVQ